MIISHLASDRRSLFACSFTSRSWYSAAVPHLHDTLIARTDYWTYSRNIKWPEPLRMVSQFGFLPFITRVFLSASLYESVAAKHFSGRTRREFSALTNVRELSIEGLDIPSFIPRIRECFGQFSPTLRSLTLKVAKGTGRQIVYFIGLFPHLEDVDLEIISRYPWNDQVIGLSEIFQFLGWDYFRERQADDLTPVPSFVPSLRGRLTVRSGHDIAKWMTDLFGELRFRHMNLRGGEIQHLLHACPNTLETLELDADCICGKKPSSEEMPALINDLAGGPHRDLDLSRNKSLRELEFPAKALIRVLEVRPPVTISSSFKAVLSTVKSTAFSDVVVVYQQGDFYHDKYSEYLQNEVGDEEAWYHRQFEVFRAMYEGRDYRLVLSASCVSEESVRELKRAVAAEQAKGGLPSRITIPYTLMAYRGYG